MQDNRIDQVLRIDVGALLNSIQDIEAKLSEYHRQDKLPPWAMSIQARLDLLEKSLTTQTREKIESISRKASASESTDITHSINRLQEFTTDEKLFGKLREEIESQIFASRLGIDSKISSLHLEIDRLNKLLQNRPTTSEMHQIMKAVTDMNLRVESNVHHSIEEIKSEVQSRIGNEMTSLIDYVKTQESVQQDGIHALINKIESSHRDATNTRQAVENGFENIQKSVISVTAKNMEVQESLKEAERQIAILNSALADTVDDKLRRIDDDTKKKFLLIDNDVKSLIEQCKCNQHIAADLEHSCTFASHRVTELEKRVSSLAHKSDEDVNRVDKQLNDLLQSTNKLAHRVCDAESFIALLQHGEGVRPGVLQQLEILDNKERENADNIAHAHSSINELELAMQAAKVDADLKIQSAFTRCDKLGLSLQSHSNDIEQLQSSEKSSHLHFVALDQGIISIEHKLLRIPAMDEEMSLLNGSVDDLGDSLVELKSRIADVDGTVAEHANRIAEMTEAVVKCEDTLHAENENMKTTLLERMEERQCEVDERLRETIETIEADLEILKEAQERVEVRTQAMFDQQDVDDEDAQGPPRRQLSGVIVDRDRRGSTGTLRPSRGADADVALLRYRRVSAKRFDYRDNYLVSDPARGDSQNHQVDRGARPEYNSNGEIDEKNYDDDYDSGQSRLVRVVAKRSCTLTDLQACINTHSHSLAELCLNFEAMAVERNLSVVPNLPDVTLTQMVASAQELTEVIAMYADCEAIQSSLKQKPTSIDNRTITSSATAQGNAGANNSAVNTGYYDLDGNSTATVNDRRIQRVDELLHSVAGCVTRAVGQPGLTRLDAREKFFRQLQRALDIAMSRHDQVMVVGSSSLGRMKIPSCIACDRPLAEKGRRGQLFPDDNMSRLHLVRKGPDISSDQVEIVGGDTDADTGQVTELPVVSQSQSQPQLGSKGHGKLAPLLRRKGSMHVSGGPGSLRAVSVTATTSSPGIADN